MRHDDNGHLGTDSFMKIITIQHYYNTINYVPYAKETLCVNHTQKKGLDPS